MRAPLLIACAAIFTMTAIGCAVDAADGSSSLSRRGPRKNQPATNDGADDQEEHDENDVQGGNQADPGNPNASTSPNAPANPGTASNNFAVTLAGANATPSVDLGQETKIEVNVEPKGAFTGSVDLTVTGLPAGVTATPTTAAVAGGPTKATITLKADYSAAVSTADVPLVVQAKNGTAVATANANFKVASKVTVTIPLNVDALRGANQLRAEYGAAFGPQGTALKAGPGGLVVTVFNADSKPHVIHGPGGNFPHGNTAAPIAPNSFEMNGGAPRTRTLPAGSNATAYLHEGAQGQGASFRVQVQ
jgi:hypothetical protein